MKKKLLTAIVMGIMIAALTGCGESADSTIAADSPATYSDIDFNEYITTMPEYKGIEVTVDKVNVTDEDVQSYIDDALTTAGYGETTDVTDRAVKEGDTVNIDYEGKLNGAAFEGGTAQGKDLVIGSNSFIDGFESGLVGANIGDTLDLNLTFPENYGSEELKGQDVVFTVTVNSISETKLPELTDEIAAALNAEYPTAAGYTEFAKEAVTKDAESTHADDVQSAVWKAVYGAAVIADPPQQIIDENVTKVTDSLNMYAEKYGIEVDEFVQSYLGSTMDEFTESAQKISEQSARETVLIRVIAAKEGIDVTQDEIDAELETDATANGYDSVDAYKEEVNADEYYDYLLSQKVMSFLADNAKITEQ